MFQHEDFLSSDFEPRIEQRTERFALVIANSGYEAVI